jgi:hypothetical protein
MPASIHDGSLSDLDFTSTVALHAPAVNEAADPTERLLQHVESIVDSIALKIELGSTDERLWRILGALYLGSERNADLSDLVKKHSTVFGHPLQFDQPPVLFTLPAKINFDDIPKIEMVRSACATPGGAIMDFSAVRRISVGGLIALTELLGALAGVTDVPEMRALEAFIGSIEHAIKGGQGSREMQDLVAAHGRYAMSRANLAVGASAAA